jgi:hypothetical protein
MTTQVRDYDPLILAIAEGCRTDLVSLASDPDEPGAPSEALVDELTRLLAGHTRVGRLFPLHTIVLGPIPRDPARTRIAAPLLDRVRERCVA